VRRKWIWAAGAAVAATAAVVLAPASDPPSSIWFNGERCLAPDGLTIPDAVRIEEAGYFHCGLETRRLSASGRVVPGFADPLQWTEPSPLRERLVSLIRTGKWTVSRTVRHVYEWSPTRQDFCDDEGTWWFRYDLRAGSEESRP
jgi:hypothetical protein